MERSVYDRMNARQLKQNRALRDEQLGHITLLAHNLNSPTSTGQHREMV
ncbi:MAG: hypothetical protein ACJAZ1_000588 [Yoonia sp.]|jgi:hypothetical protein